MFRITHHSFPSSDGYSSNSLVASQSVYFINTHWSLDLAEMHHVGRMSSYHRITRDAKRRCELVHETWYNTRDQLTTIIWTATSEFGTYSLCEQRRFRRVSPEPSLLAHISSASRGTFRQKARSLAPLNGWACAVKICHDGMLEDTNSLDGAHIMSIIYVFLS